MLSKVSVWRAACRDNLVGVGAKNKALLSCNSHTIGELGHRWQDRRRMWQEERWPGLWHMGHQEVVDHCFMASTIM